MTKTLLLATTAAALILTAAAGTAQAGEAAPQAAQAPVPTDLTSHARLEDET